MAETIGKVTNIKLANVNAGPNALDTCAVTVKEAGTNVLFVFHLWNLRDNAPALTRIISTQRLSLVREAAFRKLTVHIFHAADSTLIDQVQVDIA
jgi:hypothetical protein